MVSIETGSMQVGAAAKNFQAMPMKQVQITRGFMISATEITFEQYDLFSKTTGRALVSDRGYGRGKKPVVNVSYDDAMAYVDWLSAQTGLSFSLPSEMQWLWAATGGLNHPHAIIEKLSCQLANVSLADCHYQHAGAPQKVASYPPGIHKLYDMSGNVWEWTLDCYNAELPSGLTEHAWLQGNCERRIVKGGSWTSDEKLAHVQMRQSFEAKRYDFDIGFRIVLH
ncbi:SUMF1/EgtB/PvdO family nonheme iron enzyme [Rheinheimera sp. F8]|uniref:formylglycine-generating enzyme family protein n=1 Tax=Rheinheimera sp. F8 TaxID=1763998 RepID=UPI000744D559|nr:SUMF1/EgtB/PvdO family nonheme iron enzyme [Rheinheimera sp. F8]ALZ76719.1 hypothetical protein ATY27_13755 [Rheinheimera sp. F8]